MNSVQSLQFHPFSLRTAEEKSEVKRMGRPTPNIQIKQEVKTKTRMFNRNFNPSIYLKYEWLCGCEVSNALYCFPCLLFGGEETWVKHGIRDIQHVYDRIKKHEASTIHMKNELNLALYGNNLSARMGAAYKRNIQLHNEKVTQNRYILNIIINRIKFCGSLEFVLMDHEESESSQNAGVFHSLIKFSAELGSALRGHLEKATAFKGTSKMIQNELLQCMLEVCHEEISKEIKDAEYLAIIADETSDVASVFQIVIIYRYLVNGKPVERFWGFIRPTTHEPQSLSAAIISELEYHIQGCQNKLIAQTYDGAYIMSGSNSKVHTKVKEKYPSASYIHYHAHQLNLLMLNTASINRDVRIFFANVQGLCAFFSNSTQRTAVLDELVKKRTSYSVPTQWDFQSKPVNTIFKYRAELIECLEVIQNTHQPNTTNTLIQASGFLEILQKETFNFWLSFFHKLMFHIDIIDNPLQTYYCNPSFIMNQLKIFELDIQKFRYSMNVKEELQEKEAKRRRTNELGMKRREASEVCNMILGEIKDRFSFMGHLAAASLFHPDKFSEYKKTFPDESLKTVLEAYSFINKIKIRTELSIIYSREEFHKMSGALCLMDFITDNKLTVTFGECVKLLKVLLTIPMFTAETKRCFPTLQRVKTFLRNTISQDNLSALAMLSVEREFVMKICGFNDRVIDKFATSKEKWTDFHYK